jgi:ketosteroid isomerase-like protein
MNRDAALERIRLYYDGCTTGDVDLMLETLHGDVIHYFLAPNVGSAPVAGAEHLARYWRKVTSAIHATWVVDHILVDGDEAVIEWTMLWTPQGADDAVATRGSEWFRFDDGWITEIRSYYQQRPDSTELDGFPYGRRGYSTLDRRVSSVHQPVAKENS